MNIIKTLSLVFLITCNVIAQAMDYSSDEDSGNDYQLAVADDQSATRTLDHIFSELKQETKRIKIDDDFQKANISSDELLLEKLKCLSALFPSINNDISEENGQQVETILDTIEYAVMEQYANALTKDSKTGLTAWDLFLQVYAKNRNTEDENKKEVLANLETMLTSSFMDTPQTLTMD